MQLVKREGFFFELRPENLEDLWLLSQFISPNDRLMARTERKVKVGSETNPKQVKKLIFIELKVSKTVFEHETLRVTGEIQNETEFTSVGSTHTLSFAPGDLLELEKHSLLKVEEKMLENALKSKKSMNLLVVLDKDEMVTAEFGDFSYKIIFEKKGLGSRKYHLEEVNEDEEKYKLIEEFLKKDYSEVIFAGPGIYKDKLKKYIEDRTGLKILSHQWPEVSSQAVQKVIDDINKKGMLSQNQLAMENEKVSQLLLNIEKKAKFSYGYENTKEAVELGRAEVLILTSKFIEETREEGQYAGLNELMMTVENLNGELVIVQSRNDPGRILDGLGGIGAILRY